jgi:hypothetical protein
VPKYVRGRRAPLERRHIKHWRDARGEIPGMANMVV